MKTARLSNKPIAELVGILDSEVAFAFSRECADIEFEFDLERETRMYEAMGLGAVTNALGGNTGSKVTVDRSGPTTLNA